MERSDSVSMRLVGIGLLEIVKGAGNGRDAGEENDEIHDNLLLGKKEPRADMLPLLPVFSQFSPA